MKGTGPCLGLDLTTREKRMRKNSKFSAKTEFSLNRWTLGVSFAQPCACCQQAR